MSVSLWHRYFILNCWRARSKFIIIIACQLMEPVIQSTKKSQAPRSRRWTLTLNNYSLMEHQFLFTKVSMEEGDGLPLSYMILGKEVGEEGTPHLQGYLECSSRMSLKTLKSHLLDRCHLEVAKGNHKQNYDYCSKDGDFEERGKPMAQGSKNHDVTFANLQDEVIWRAWLQAFEKERLSKNSG